jgi:Flp pilus assembly pilin Flp
MYIERNILASRTSAGTIMGIMTMKTIILKIKTVRDTRGQDLIEYALMAGFVAVAAGAIMPNIATSLSTIFSQVGSVIALASTQGS